jgi:tetratricopeptide (TPR) repeat protein
VHQNSNQPTGFQGPVSGFAALSRARDGAAVLRLPRDGAAPAGLGEGGPASFDAIEVTAFTESMGTVETALRRLCELLRPDGTLLLGVENAQSLRCLRAVLEGRPGTFDPVGSIVDPCQPLALRRLVLAAEAAGLRVDDVVRVPDPDGELRPGFAAAMFEQGLLPLDWLHGAPPARFWLACSRRPALAGSVLIGSGDAAARHRTEACVRAWLPAGWEVLPCEGASEGESWSRGIARARGDLVWFLRAGAVPTAELFAELALLAELAPAAPGAHGERQHPGDLCGLMLPRRDLLVAGPLRAAENSVVACEEYCLRLEATGPAIAVVEGALYAPKAPVENPRTFAPEAASLLAGWQTLARDHMVSALEGATRASAAPSAPPWIGRAPRVSLCMIARDEHRFLAECLRRAQPAVDEIVLVDTGSKDDTVAIAESFGAKVLHRAWDDDFSAPRNAGIAAATGDWILVLDADEFLVPGAAESIRAVVQRADVAGYHMRFTNLYTGGKTVGVMMVRLFRNLPGVVYQNVIHEQVTPTLVAKGRELGLVLSACDVEVEHHGYCDEVMDGRGKAARNERLFEKQLRLQPDDIYCLYKYGDFLRRVPGRSADAQALLERCLDRIASGPPSLPRELPYAGEVAALCALEHARQDRTDRALGIVDHALRRFIPTPNLHYIAASLLLARGAAHAAIAHFRRCLAYRGQVLVVPIQEGITGHVSLLGIAQALTLLGDVERSRRLAERAVAMAPGYEVGAMVLSKLQLTSGDAAGALQTLTGYLAAHPDAAGVCQQTTLILQRLGCVDQARRMGARALELLQQNGADREAARMQEILAAL